MNAGGGVGGNNYRNKKAVVAAAAAVVDVDGNTVACCHFGPRLVLCPMSTKQPHRFDSHISFTEDIQEK